MIFAMKKIGALRARFRVFEFAYLRTEIAAILTREKNVEDRKFYNVKRANPAIDPFTY